MAIELYPHNERAYQKVKEMFKTSNRAAVIHPTGSGKTPISIKLMLDNPNARILYLTSTYQILAKFKKTVQSFGIISKDLPHLKGQIYSNLLSLTTEELKEQFDFIVLDEFHRCGAQEWSKGVDKLLESNPDAKILGLTATHIRFLDNERDMAYELFENNIASKISLAQALLEEILPIPNYVSVVESFNTDIKKLEERIEKIKVATTKERALKQLKRIKKTVVDAPKLDEVFAKHITKKDGRLIVFCKDLAHLEEIKKNIHELFGKVNNDIEVFEVTYKTSDNDKTIERFENSDSKSLKVILTIDMLNEGVHLKKLDGVVMLRRTVSPIIYLQQLGRALSVNGGVDTPLIFDVADNIRATESVYDLYAEFDRVARAYEEAILTSDLTETEKLAKLKHVRDLKVKFNIISEVQEATELITKLNKFIGFGFEEYYELLTDYYQVNGNIDVPADYVVNGITLGRWIVKCRQAKKSGNLTQKQIEMLEQYGMIWNKNEEAFVIGLNYAKEYFNEFGNLLVPATYFVNGYGLGNFIRKQRTKYKKEKLSQEQILLLEEIGMVWDVREHEFMQGYKYAKEYFEAHGNLDVPSGYVIDGFELDSWLIQKRKNRTRNSLTKKEIELLDAFNFEWKNIEEEWSNNFALAKQYYEEHQHLDVVKKENPELYTWLANQRERYQKNSIKPERKKLLDSIGMIWNLLEHRFLTGYGYAKRYFEEFGNLDVPKDYVFLDNPEFDLHEWLIERRKNKERMDAEHIKLLDDLNFDWNPNYTKWLKGYNVAKKYYLEFGDLLVPAKTVYEEYNLGNFIANNRQNYKKGKLREEQILMLEEIGMVWDVRAYKEQELITKLYEYQAAILNAETLSEELISWKERIIESFKENKLTLKQVELLYAFGLISDLEYTNYLSERNDSDVPKL